MRPGHRDPRALGLVALGGSAGAAARYGVGLAVGAHAWPWATTVVNLSGALALGLLTGALAAAGGATPALRRVRLLVGTGFLGAFTTYSTLSLEVAERLRAGSAGTAVGYALASLVVGLLASLLGLRGGALLVGRWRRAPRAGVPR